MAVSTISAVEVTLAGDLTGPYVTTTQISWLTRLRWPLWSTRLR